MGPRGRALALSRSGVAAGGAGVLGGGARSAAGGAGVLGGGPGAAAGGGPKAVAAVPTLAADRPPEAGAGAAASDRIGEISLAAATIVAVIALAITLQALTRRKRGREGLTGALVIATAGAGIAFASYLSFEVRCDRAGCGVRPGDDIAGLDPWWRTHDTWQWGAQLELASAGLMLGAIALALAVREHPRAPRALTAARLAYFSWAILVFFVPLLWELLVI